MLDIFTWLPTRDLGEVTMKFMIAYTIKPAHFQAAVSRFLETGGTPPDGLRMLGRWHSASKGWSIGDTDDVKKVYEWTTRWNDLLEFTVTPVMDDAELGEMLARIRS